MYIRTCRLMRIKPSRHCACNCYRDREEGTRTVFCRVSPYFDAKYSVYVHMCVRMSDCVPITALKNFKSLHMRHVQVIMHMLLSILSWFWRLCSDHTMCMYVCMYVCIHVMHSDTNIHMVCGFAGNTVWTDFGSYGGAQM